MCHKTVNHDDHEWVRAAKEPKEAKSRGGPRGQRGRNGLPAYRIRTRGWRVLGDRLFSSPQGHETQELDPRTGDRLRRVPRAASEYRNSLFGTR